MSMVKDMTVLTDFLRVSAEKYPNKPAVIFEKQTQTYAELSHKSDRIAQFLLDQGVRKGEVVGVLLPNSLEFLMSYFGVLKAGAIALLLPPNISDEKLQFQIDKTELRILLTESKYVNKIGRLSSFQKQKYFFLPEVLSFEGKQKLPQILPEDTSTIIFTSGTTSEPKGVQLQHKNVVQATKNIIEFLEFQHSDIDINISALSHSFGLGHVHCIFAVGGTVVLFRDAINLPKIIKSIVIHKATTMGAVPAILRLLVQHYKDAWTDSSKTLRFVQTDTSLLEPELIHSVLSALPHSQFAYYYGLTEASRSTFMYFNKHPTKTTSVGQASPNVEVAILDEDNKKMETGKLGEICIAGEHVISQYWRNPEASKKIQGKWFHTGDVGYMDSDNFVYYVSRTGDVMNISGEKVSAEEIEMTVLEFPGVKEVAAIGVPDDILGEVVKVFVVFYGKTFPEKKILNFCREKLESYKVPRYIEQISELPRTDNGKLQRKKLREMQ